MTYDAFKQAVAQAARAHGLEVYDLYYVAGSSTMVTSYEGEIDQFSDTSSRGAGFRCVVDGSMGYANTQKLCPEEAERLVRDAMAGARAMEAKGFTQIYQGGGQYAALPEAEDAPCDVERLKAAALELERLAQTEDARVESTPFSAVQYSAREVALSNAFGLDLHTRQTGYGAHYEAVVSEGGRKYTGSGSAEALSLEGLGLERVAQEAVGLAVGSIGGSSVPSGTWPVIFSARMMSELLACFAGVFSADAAQKGLSLLAGREGEQIASPLLTIIDDPHYKGSLDTAPFDDEGVPTYTKTVVDKGVLKTMLYDLKSATKAGAQSTGNGRRVGYAGDVNVSPFTLYIQGGDDSLATLMERAGRAIYITELKGLHAGLSPVTGDFSLESKGYLVEGGKVARPAEQFTVAGNLFTALREIGGLADDFRLDGGVGAPSVLFKGLSIAGQG